MDALAGILQASKNGRDSTIDRSQAKTQYPLVLT